MPFDKRQKDSDRAKVHTQLLKDLKRLQGNMAFKKKQIEEALKVMVTKKGWDMSSTDDKVYCSVYGARIRALVRACNQSRVKKVKWAIDMLGLLASGDDPKPEKKKTMKTLGSKLKKFIKVKTGIKKETDVEVKTGIKKKAGIKEKTGIKEKAGIKKKTKKGITKKKKTGTDGTTDVGDPYFYGFDTELWKAWRLHHEASTKKKKDLATKVWVKDGSLPTDPVMASWRDGWEHSISQLTVSMYLGGTTGDDVKVIKKRKSAARRHRQQTYIGADRRKVQVLG